MNTIRQRVFTNWHFMRVLRLGLGVWMLVTAVQAHDLGIGLFSVFFLYTAIAGVGCCGINGCYVPENAGAEKAVADVDHEEIK